MAAPVLTILDGLQAGSRTRLASGGSLIGTGTGCAVVVADPAMRSDHFEIVVGDTTTLRALCPVTLPDGTALAPGALLALSGPTAFSAGGTRFLLEVPVPEPAPPSAPAAPPARWRRFAPSATLLLATLGTVLGTGMWLGHRVTVGVQPALAATMSLNHPPSPRVGDVVEALRTRLAKAGLPGVTVSTQPDGTVLVGGLLTAGDEPAWTGIRQWFDGRYGNAMVMVERFDAPGALPPLRIAAVWAGAHPYVVDDHGERLHPGAAIGDGWFVGRIEPGSVLANRGPQAVSLRYKP